MATSTSAYISGVTMSSVTPTPLGSLNIDGIGYRWMGLYASNLGYKNNDVVYYKSSLWRVDNGKLRPFLMGNQGGPGGGGSIATGGSGFNETGAGWTNTVLHSRGDTLTPLWKFMDQRNGTLARGLLQTHPQTSTYGGTFYGMGAVMADGSARSWGNLRYGMAGVGDMGNINSTLPRRVAFPHDFDAEVVTSYGVWTTRYFLDSKGRLWGTGTNGEYQQGIAGDTANKPIPQLINGRGDIASDTVIVDFLSTVDYSEVHTCLALDDQGRVYAWGNNNAYKLGNETTTTIQEPWLIPITEQIPMKKMYMSSGGAYDATWLISEDGQAYGAGHMYALGMTLADYRKTHQLISVPWGMEPIAQIYASQTDYHAGSGFNNYCKFGAVLENGDYYAWGYGTSYGHGIAGSVASYWSPIKVNEGVVKAGALDGYYSRGLCLKDDGTVETFGYNGVSLNESNAHTTEWSQRAPGVLENIIDMDFWGAQYSYSAWFKKSDGTIWVLGDNTYGQTGTGTTVVPVGSNVSPMLLDKAVVDIQGAGYSTGGTNYLSYHMLTADGCVYSTGYGGYGETGDDDAEHSYVPRQIMF